MKGFTICFPHQILFGQSNKKWKDRSLLCMRERKGAYRDFVRKNEEKRPIWKT